MAKTKEYAEIAENSDDTISEAILQWADLEPVWVRHCLGAMFNFATDVAFKCRDIDVKTEAWSNLPGHGGVWYSVSTFDAGALRTEMRHRTARLLWSSRAELRKHRQRMKVEAEARDEKVRRGVTKSIRVTDSSATFVIQDFKKEEYHQLDVSLEDWRDIQRGEAIQYEHVSSSYKGLLFRFTWQFNVVAKGSVQVLHFQESKTDVRFAGSIEEFLPADR